MKCIDFAKSGWESCIDYAYSLRFDKTPKFVQDADGIRNQKNDCAKYGYDNISLMTGEKYTYGTTVATTCSLEGDACPLIVIANDLFKTELGVWQYSDYIEVVLWNGGITVWVMKMTDEGIKWNRRMRVLFPVPEGDKNTFSVTVTDKYLCIKKDEQEMLVRIEEIPETFHVGINACEGICKFYNLTIKEGEE